MPGISALWPMVSISFAAEATSDTPPPEADPAADSAADADQDSGHVTIVVPGSDTSGHTAPLVPGLSTALIIFAVLVGLFFVLSRRRYWPTRRSKDQTAAVRNPGRSVLSKTRATPEVSVDLSPCPTGSLVRSFLSNSRASSHVAAITHGGTTFSAR